MNCSPFRSVIILFLLVLIASLFAKQHVQGDDSVSAKDRVPVVVGDEARRIHRAALLVDGHNDLPWELREKGSLTFEKLDIAKPQPKLHTDIPRLKQGGLGAQFWSVYVPASTAYDGTALVATLEQIEMVHAMVDYYSGTFEMASTADDIQRIHASGKIASLIGVEGGHCIENSLGILRQLYRLGARYMTLTHSDTLQWADSATDEAKHGGLTAFGEEVVAEMNRLGMLVDLSHVSPETMEDALRVSKSPIIFSHSSARAIANHPRNVPDDVLRLVAENRGVVMVNFYSSFVVPESAARGVDRYAYRKQLRAEIENEEKVQAKLKIWESQHPIEPGTIHHVIDHIDHIKKIAGVDCVGIGADFDGVPVLPAQLQDVSTYPFITQALLDRGYTESEILKILGGNLLRVMRQAEEVAQRMQGE